MDHRQDDPLTDSSLDREIQSALAVDPSPEFLARVRTRVASELPGRAWRLIPSRWSFEPLVAVSVLGVVIAIVVPAWMREPSVPAIRLKPDTTAADRTKPDAIDTTVRQREPAQTVRAKRDPAFRSVRRVRLQPDQTDASPFREVLVSADEARMFNAIVAQVGAGRLPELPQAAALSEPPAPIEVPELVIEPLRTAQLDAETGERP